MMTLVGAYTNLCVLITGGAGFIGSHVAEQLVNQGAHVRILDNLSTGKRENIAHIQNKIEFIHGDITDYQTCLKAMHDVSIVFHLAAQISVPGSVKDPLHCFKTNITGTLNLLEAARVTGVKRFIFSSSSAIYGSQDEVFVENSTTPSPESPYGLSKFIGELLCAQYFTLYNLETVCLRYFNVYGLRQDPQAPYAAVVAKFRESMELNKPLIIYGDGYQTRDFITVQEVAYANLIMGIADKSLVAGQIYNIGTGTSINLFQLADMIKKEFPDFNAGFVFHPARPGDVKHTRASCAKYQDLLATMHIIPPHLHQIAHKDF